MTYTYQEALAASKEYFNHDELPAKVWCDKYALRNDNDELLELTPVDSQKRLAKEFARIEAKKFKKPLSEDKIFELFYREACLIPQGSPTYAIGNPYQYVSASNCFVIASPEDSYGGILRADQELVQISKRRGGVGIDISSLRPTNAPTKNSSRTSTGTATWMERFSNSIREVGQCLHGDSLVITSNGLKKIKNVRPGEMIWTKSGWVQNLKTLKNGKKKLYKITTEAGYSVISSQEHIYQSFDIHGKLIEKKLSEFEAGDGIVLCLGNATQTAPHIQLNKSTYKNSNNKPQNCILPDILDEKLAYLLGYSYGDGSVDWNQYGNRALELACSNDYPQIKSKLDEYCISVFDYQINYRPGDGDLEKLSINNKTIVDFLEYNGLLKQKAGSIVFPETILKSPTEVQIAFLSGYFDADGDACGVKCGYRFRSIDLTLLEQTQIILSSLGIASKISFEDRSNKGWNTLYSLAIIGKTSQEKFVELFQLSCKVKNTSFISKRDGWLTPFKAKSFGIKKQYFSYCPDNSQFLSLSCINKLKVDKQNVITTLLQDKIESIIAYGEDDTYDLILEEEHLFWCNGIYVHNSGRRGALMQTISVHHPDISVFSSIKNDNTKVTGANISVRLTDDFLNAVDKDEEYEQYWYSKNKSGALEKVVTGKVKAKPIWDQLIYNAWNRAEPGLLFWDNILRESPADCYAAFGFLTISTNPCGEITLSAYDSCRLLAINLFYFVVNPYTTDAYFDYKKFYEYAQIAQRLMDDLVDLEIECLDRIINKIRRDPEPETVKQIELSLWENTKRACLLGRRTGLGITALGDTLAAINIKYGSDDSIRVTEHIYKTLKFGAYRSSVDMAKELGAFPVWNHELEKDNPFLNRISKENLGLTDDTNLYIAQQWVSGQKIYEDMKQYGRRNIALLTTAPVGTKSTQAYLMRDLFGTSSGIEPQYTWKPYVRRKKGNPGDNDFRSDFVDQSGDHWMEFNVYPSGVQAWMKVNNTTELDQSCPYVGASAEEIVWTQRVKLQAAAQKHIDHSISSTVNLPANTTVDEVAKIYKEAWKSGCKGITVYRDGCRTGVLVKQEEEKHNDRPKELPCEVYHTTSKGKSYFVLVGIHDDKPYEVFAGENGFIDKSVKHGKIVKMRAKQYKAIFDDETELTPITARSTEHEETITRLSSALLRSGVSIHIIVQQLEKVHGDLHSFAKALARILKKYIPDGTKELGEVCPECKQKTIIRQDGCQKCASCSWSKCY